MSPQKKSTDAAPGTATATETATATASSNTTVPYIVYGRGIGRWGANCTYQLFLGHGYNLDPEPVFRSKPQGVGNNMSGTTHTPHTVAHTAPLNRPYSTGTGWGLGEGRIASPFDVAPTGVIDPDPYAHNGDLARWGKISAAPFTLLLCVLYILAVVWAKSEGSGVDWEDCAPGIRWWKGLWEGKANAKKEDKGKRVEREGYGEREGIRMEYRKPMAA